MSELSWPAEQDRTPVSEREPYPHGFSVTRSEAFDSILKELRRMDATNVQLDTGAEHQKANPNKPYARSSFDDPGVVARWEIDGQSYQMAMDQWDNPRDNARAIAKTLDAKRAIPRYGVETIESEYQHHELPSPDDVVVAGSEPAHEVLGVDPDASDREVESAFRELIQESHPDKPDGSVERFTRVREAREVMLSG